MKIICILVSPLNTCKLVSTFLNFFIKVETMAGGGHAVSSNQKPIPIVGQHAQDSTQARRLYIGNFAKNKSNQNVCVKPCTAKHVKLRATGTVPLRQ